MRSIQPDRLGAWQRRPRQRSQDADGPVGQHEPRDPAEQREHEPFSHQLTNDATRAGAERGAEGQLALPGTGSRQHQVRDVGTRDQQHDGDSAGEDQNHSATVADDLLDEGPHRQRQLLRHRAEHRGIAFCQRAGCRVHIRPGLRHRHTRLQARQDAVVVHAAESLPLVWGKGNREIQRRRLAIALGAAGRKHEPLPRHADDGEGLSIERQRPADDRRIPAERARPEPVVEHDDAGTGPVVFFGEGAPEHRAHAEQVEEPG